MRTLYLMRHGTTIFNERNKVQGWGDSPLSAYGRRQAAWMGRWFAEHGVFFDHAYCSTSGRTAQTLELATRSSMPYARLGGLRKFYFGLLEGESASLVAPDPFGEFLVQFGGESTARVTERMVATLTDIMGRDGHECVLAVSHGSSGFAFYQANERRSDIDLGGRLPPHASAIRYDFDGEKFFARQLIVPVDDELDQVELPAESEYVDIVVPTRARHVAIPARG
ncbi:histidine phosphatase family protein [Atopobiaceae bacterium LCP21S3_F11]